MRAQKSERRDVMTKDKYCCYEHLEAGEVRGRTYDTVLKNRASNIAVVAPHGGWIEHGTTQIADAIAGANYSFYSLRGLGHPRKHSDLHITSHKFNDPDCLALVAKSVVVVGIHGRQNGDGTKGEWHDDQTTWLGGLHISLRRSIADALRQSEFKAIASDHDLKGEEPANICNLGSMKAGVQLEIPRKLRNELVDSASLLEKFAASVRNEIEKYLANPGRFTSVDCHPLHRRGNSSSPKSLE